MKEAQSFRLGFATNNELTDALLKMRRYIRNKHTGEYLKADGWTRFRSEAMSFPTIPEAVRAGMSHEGELELVLFVSPTASEIPLPIRDLESNSL